AYLRFHGRNRETWNARNLTVAERYKYLYSERELAEWAERIRGLGGISRAHVIFNNCYRNFGGMNATTMRAMLARSEGWPRDSTSFLPARFSPRSPTPLISTTSSTKSWKSTTWSARNS